MFRTSLRPLPYLIFASLLFLLVRNARRSSEVESYRLPLDNTWTAELDDGNLDFSDKTIVVASTTRSNTSWVAEVLPDWRHAIYVVDDKSAPLHTEMNKGNEANVYLRYIIDNYDSLPSVVVFTHDHRKSQHIDRFFEDNPDSVRRLNLTHVKKVGYQSLSCGVKYICRTDKFTKHWSALNDHLHDAWPHMFPGVKEPEALSGPCCAQFAVTKAAIHRRSRADYQRMHAWLMDTEQNDFFSGRTFEHTWHYTFGMPAWYCQEKDVCACDAFGICDLKTHLAGMGIDEDPEAARANQIKEWEGIQALPDP